MQEKGIEHIEQFAASNELEVLTKKKLLSFSDHWEKMKIEQLLNTKKMLAYVSKEKHCITKYAFSGVQESIRSGLMMFTFMVKYKSKHLVESEDILVDHMIGISKSIAKNIGSEHVNEKVNIYRMADGTNIANVLISEKL